MSICCTISEISHYISEMVQHMDIVTIMLQFRLHVVLVGIKHILSTI